VVLKTWNSNIEKQSMTCDLLEIGNRNIPKQIILGLALVAVIQVIL
jgi:hypothetical protein